MKTYIVEIWVFWSDGLRKYNKSFDSLTVASDFHRELYLDSRENRLNAFLSYDEKTRRIKDSTWNYGVVEISKNIQVLNTESTYL